MIRILGAGPAGLAAAIHLSRNGVPVTVYEKHGTVGSRFSGDLQGLENFSSGDDIVDRLRAYSIDIGPVCTAVRAGMVVGPAAHAVIGSNQPFFYLLERGDFAGSLDVALKEQAVRQGVTIVFNANADPADCDILASGPVRPRIFGYGQIFRTSCADTAISILDNAVVPGGYAYLLASRGHATLAVIRFGAPRDMRSCLARAVDRFRNLLDFTMEEPKAFAGSGSFCPQYSAVREGKLLVGEAAGFQDYLFGFGMRYALLSGVLAAKSIIDGSDYDRLWRKEFGGQLQVSRINRMFYALFGPLMQNALVRGLRRSNEPRRLLELCYRSSLLCVPFR